MKYVNNNRSKDLSVIYHRVVELECRLQATYRSTKDGFGKRNKANKKQPLDSSRVGWSRGLTIHSYKTGLCWLWTDIK